MDFVHLQTTILTWTFKSVGAIVALLITTAIVQEIRRPKRLPPTPGNKRPLPFFGHKLDIPKEKSWIKFREWNEAYGPILTVWNGNVPTILVGDPEVSLYLYLDWLHKIKIGFRLPRSLWRKDHISTVLDHVS